MKIHCLRDAPDGSSYQTYHQETIVHSSSTGRSEAVFDIRYVTVDILGVLRALRSAARARAAHLCYMHELEAKCHSLTLIPPRAVHGKLRSM